MHEGAGLASGPGQGASARPAGAAASRGLLDHLARAWPVVGRHGLVDEVRRQLTTTPRAGVALTGPAGVGKTRLAQAVVAELGVDGFASEWITGSETSRDIPLAAFAHLLPTPRDDAPAHDVLDLLRRTSAELAERASAGPLVLGVDDADRLDPGSATLLASLCSRSVVSVLLTVRTGSPVPDAIGALWKDGHVRRVEVPPLDEADVAEITAAALGGVVEQATLHRLWQATAGNPLFLREVVVAGIEGGSLRDAGGVWRWHGSIGSGTRLREMVEERLGRLRPEHRRHLEALAFAEPLGVSDFEALAGIEVVDLLERLELLAVARDGQRQHVRLAHPLYGEVLRAATPPLRARAIQRELAAAALERPARRRQDLLVVARWQLESGTASDPDLLVAAATQAAGGFQFPLAERLARVALAAGAGAEASDVLAQSLRGQDRPDEAEDVWAAVGATPARSVDEAAMITSRAMNRFFGLGDEAGARAILLDAEHATDDADARHVLRANRALIALYGGQADEAIAIARPLLDSSAVGAPHSIDAAIAVATASALDARTTDALDLVERTLPVALSHPATAMINAGVLIGIRFVALSAAGRLHDALHEASGAYELAVDADQHEGMAVLGCATGQALLGLGDVDGAVGRLRQAAALLHERDRNRYLPWCLGALAQALVFAGDREGAAAALAEADATRTPGVRLFEVEVERGRAWVTAARGDVRAAHDVLAATAAWALEAGQGGLAAAAMHDRVRLGGADDVAAPLRDLAEQRDSALVAAYAQHAAAARERDPAALHSAGDAFEELGALVLAAEAHGEAAAAHERVGRTGSAAAAAARASELVRRCPGARSPTLDGLDRNVPLTRREHEVALLAAQGRTSRQIAAELYVSVRTVDNHLHRAYEKLGVRNRGELARVLGIG